MHIGLEIKRLMDKKRMSVDSDIAPILGKSRSAVFADFRKEDLHLKTILIYLDLCSTSIQEFLQIDTDSTVKSNNTVQEPVFQYQKTERENPELLKKEKEMLEKILAEKERLLEEKERTIGLLLSNSTNSKQA